MTGEEKTKAGIGIGLIAFMIIMALIMQNQTHSKISNKPTPTIQADETVSPFEKPDEQTDEERYEASRNIEIGDICILNGGGSMNVIGTNYEDLKALNKAALAGDNQAVVEMYYQGKAFAVPSGTKVLFIDSSWAGRKIRILEGDYEGKGGWVSRDYIQPIK